MSVNVVDFFCGCGGTSAGLKKAGMNIIAGIDIDSQAIRTYQYNFPEAKGIVADITKMQFDELSGILKKNTKQNDLLLFAACAPCQPFSRQNRFKSSSDKRISLLNEFHRFVKKFFPDYIILENVPGMQKVTEGPFTKFTKLLTDLNYQFRTDVKNAMDYGVPQSRKRLVLIASRHGVIELPEETHGKDKIPYKTVEEAIKKYPPLQCGEKNLNIPNHQCAHLSPLLLRRITALKEGGSRGDWGDELKLKCHNNHSGHTDVYGRLSWNKPSVTLTTRCVSLSNGRFGHPEQNRALSVREAAAIQTFDDDFIFFGSLGETAKQVGNAVPVNFALALGKQVIKHIKGIKNGQI